MMRTSQRPGSSMQITNQSSQKFIKTNSSIHMNDYNAMQFKNRPITVMFIDDQNSNIDQPNPMLSRNNSSLKNMSRD